MSFTKEEFNLLVVGLVKQYKLAFDVAAKDFSDHILAVECLKHAVGPGLDPKKLADFAKKSQAWVTLPVVGFVPLVLRAGGTALVDKLAGTKTPSILGEAMKEVTGKNKPGRGLVKVPTRPMTPRPGTPRPGTKGAKVSALGSLVARESRRASAAARNLKVPGLKSVPAGRVFDPTGALNWGYRILGEMGPLLGALQMHEAGLVGMNPKFVPKGRQSSVGQILAKARQPEQLKTAMKVAVSNLAVAWEQLQKAIVEMERHRKELKLPPVAL